VDVVVDTNVAMVASRHSPQANKACADACVQRLNQIMEHGGLLVDDSRLILSEYVNALGHTGRSGAGEKFAKWAFSNQSNPEVVRKISITQRTDHGWRRFDQFPARADLQTFDKSDQKFVAVALASGDNPPILNAVDSDWWQHRDALAQAGVRVEFLCPQHRPG
jgi:hypothetical protein